MQFIFSERDRYILQVWSDTVIHGGHWGDGDVVFPDEAILLEKIGNTEPGEAVELSSRDLQVLLVWSESSHGTPEEEILSGRLREAAAS